MSSTCQRGIMSKTLETDYSLFDYANKSEEYHDLYFYGTFCPFSNGAYRLIYEGSVNDYLEPLYSSYKFNNILMKERTTPYHYLYAKTCYPFKTAQSINSGVHNAFLYYQKENEEKVLISHLNSLSCEKMICMKGSKDPKCSPFRTMNNSCRSSLYLGLIIFIIAS